MDFRKHLRRFEEQNHRCGGMKKRPIDMMKHTATVVYLTPKTKSEREIYHDILAPHSWAAGEHGLMLTDTAFEECVKHLSWRTKKPVKTILRKALEDVKHSRAG